MAKLFTFETRDATAIRDGILRTIKNGLLERGVTNPNITPGSDWYILATAVGNQLAVVEANAAIKADEVMPDTATGDGLARIGDLLGLGKQPAAGSVGGVILTLSASETVVITGAQLVDDAGQRYEVTTGGLYADEATVPIRAIDTGRATNHEEGDVLRWASRPPFADERAFVATGGLTNGIDAEDDEALRARVLAKLRTPPRSGNWEHVAEIAEEASPAIQKAFVYPAIQGPATLHVAVTAAPTDTDKDRDVASATMTGTVVPYVQGQLPEHAYSVITTVANVNADVAIGLTIPDAPTASPPGPGGGWANGAPWPVPDASTSMRCRVTMATSVTLFTVDAVTPPTVGVTRIAWLSPFDWTLYTALVIASTGSTGAYEITIDTPFVDIAIGCYIWPEAENAQAYVDAILAKFALMGPGEKSVNASALARGFRHPRSASGWPMTLGGHLLNALTTEATPEVEAAQFFYRSDGTTTIVGTAGQVTPQVPASVSDPPKLFVPRHLAFYQSS